MEGKNQIVNKNTGKPKLKFSEAIQTEEYQKLLGRALSTPARVNRFVTSVIAAVAANPKLSDCDNGSIVSAALQGEALNLSPSPALGEYALVPYKKYDKAKGESVYIAQFQIMTNGRVQLAFRSGLYEDLDAIEIREGEYKGKDRFTGKPVLEFIEDDGDRENRPIIGYYAYYKLKNGFFKSVYFSKEKVLQWAERYSKAFDRKLYEKYIKGEITDKSPWAEQTAVTAPWYNNFDEMAKNVVLRQVLKKAPKSTEMISVEEKETEDEKIGDVFYKQAQGDAETKVDEELFGNEEQSEEQPEPREDPKPEEDTGKKKRPRKAKPEEPAPTAKDTDSAEQDDFFSD